ncbi:NAD(P)/FAD-dependent oxidoreductase [Streptomyces muensis]|uniref:NAD(P)/FAD-dependent oxidoreductase n=1 Tax=Streptomyces muensis TaxID=1077944 RepID=A0A9X1Q135_STRM4|nr:NAD(P)/FAD-dependent oxidoreductase [Streptomyces muensis]MCF1595949.1 NAD(P)/FAD-dependent oxidoreductase [Streptomyces muensis]
MTRGEPCIGIVGAGIAGLRAANALLKCKVDARIVIFGDETHRTYNRPGLTKKRYPSSDAPGTTIAEDLKVNGVENKALTWRLDTRVETADLREKVLRLSTGETFAYDALVIASGVRPRTSVEGDNECEFHAHRTLRGLDDAQHIHSELQTSKKVTIAGAGFVACELASLAKEYGCEVVMLETRRHGPFESILGRRIAMALGRWITQNGVTFLTGDSAKELLCDPGASNLESSSDRPLFIEAIGSVPNVEWLRGNGLDLSDGVRVDAYMRVPEREGVFAAGDIARYPDPWTTEDLTRMEFWKNAIDTGDLAGRSVASSLGYDSKTSRIGYFPSIATEVFGLRIQIAGNPKTSDSMEIVRGDLDQLDCGVLVKFLRGEVMVGAAYMDKGARFNSVYIELLKSLKAH